MKSDLRLKESQKFLAHLGVQLENIISIGKILDIDDGAIYLKLDEIYSELDSCLKKILSIEEIVCTAYEGGHHDHDSSSVLARALAKKFNSKLLEFYLYNGHGTQNKFYKVFFRLI